MESSEGTEAARQFFLKASVVLSCRMRGKSWFVANRWGKDVDIPQGIGIIIEHPGFLRDYSGFQNLKLLARLQKKITDEKIKREHPARGA